MFWHPLTQETPTLKSRKHSRSVRFTAAGPQLASPARQEEREGLKYLSAVTSFCWKANNVSGEVTWVASLGAPPAAFPLTRSAASRLRPGAAGGGRQGPKPAASGQPSPPQPGAVSLRRQGGCLRGARDEQGSQPPEPRAGVCPDIVPRDR